MTATAILVLLPLQRSSAQEDRRSTERTQILRQMNQRKSAALRTPDELRSEMNALFDEIDASMKYLSDYAISREAFQKVGYDGYSAVVSALAVYRKQLQDMSNDTLRQLNDHLPDSTAMNNLTVALHKMRFDPEYQAALERSEKRFSSANGQRSLSQDSNQNARSTVSATAFIRPVCHFDDLINYPSAKDVAIARSFAFIGEIAYLLIPPGIDIPIIGAKVPNPVRIAVAIAWGVAEAIAIGLKNARDEGTWCQSLAFTMQSVMTTDGSFNVSILLPRSAGGFADFLRDLVTANVANARADAIPVPSCVDALMIEGDNYYNQQKWIEAYKKYRRAYQSINAPNCEPRPTP